MQRDIKSLMKFEPASRILTEDPALAERVSSQRMQQPPAVLQDTNVANKSAEQKHKSAASKD